MLYVKPSYYHKFKCTADKCEATCCAGWQIVIDEASLERYEKEKSDYGDLLRERIDWAEGVFKQDSCRRCAFLNPDNLCDMYRHLGEDSLCMTCANYPRHIEEFENLREITLAISCPEVAHIILNQKEPVTFVEEELEGDEEEFEDFDLFFFSYLEDGRNILLGILQNRGWNIGIRFGLAQRFAEEMQEIIENADLFELADLFEKYEDASFLSCSVQEIDKECSAFYQNASDAFCYSKARMGRLYELEHLSDDWEEYLEQCWQTLYQDGAEQYQDMHLKFTENCSANLPIILEQLLVYFIFTYFCGAVYDYNVLGKVDMSLTSVYNIYEMFIVKWARQGEKLSMQDMERVVYRYSRELEHSDVNLDRLENNI